MSFYQLHNRCHPLLIRPPLPPPHPLPPLLSPLPPFSSRSSPFSSPSSFLSFLRLLLSFLLFLLSFFISLLSFLLLLPLTYAVKPDFRSALFNLALLLTSGAEAKVDHQAAPASGAASSDNNHNAAVFLPAVEAAENLLRHYPNHVKVSLLSL